MTGRLCPFLLNAGLVAASLGVGLAVIEATAWIIHPPPRSYSIPRDMLSQASIKQRIKELVEKEDTRDPLSDDKLAELLEEKHGIKIARRTITKYRKALGIAS